MRLDKFLSDASPLSRAEARRVIRRGLVPVDGMVVRQAAAAVSECARICLHDGRDEPVPLRRQGPRYLMLHKPADCVCATQDPVHRTVFDLLPVEMRSGLRSVGRLDRDTTGLLLLTDDGAWLHRLTSPRHKVIKVYQARLARPLDAAAVAQLCAGVLLRGEQRPTAPAEVTRLADGRVEIHIGEGRYHQVKRMFAAVGNHVLSLHRAEQGGLRLDTALPPGAWRALRADELAQLAEPVLAAGSA